MSIPRLLLGIALSTALLISVALGETLINPFPRYQVEKAARMAELNELYERALKTIAEAEAMGVGRLATTEAKSFREAIGRDRAGGEPGSAAVQYADPPATPADRAARQKREEELLGAVKKAKEAKDQAAKKMQGEVVSFAVASWRNLSTLEECAALFEVVKAAGAERPLRDLQASGDPASPLLDIEQILTAAVTFFQAVKERNLPLVKTALPRLRTEQFRAGHGMGRRSMEEWRARQKIEARKRLERLRGPALGELLASRGPAEKLLQVADDIEFHLELEKLLSPGHPSFDRFGESRWMTDQEEAGMKFARSWARLLSQIDEGNLTAAAELATKIDIAVRGYSAAAHEAVKKELAKLAEGAARQKEEGLAALDRRAREGLANIDSAAAATALADELRAERATAPGGPVAKESEQLETRLRELAEYMSSDTENPRNLLREETAVRNSGWAVEMKALRERVYRRAFCRRADSPELMQAPLAEISLREAIEQLAGELHRAGNWSKLLRLLSTQHAMDYGDRAGQEGEDFRAVKAFLTAQNLEKAELYTEAAEAYRSVLSCIGDYAPVDAAADRLKAIRKDHPEALERLSPSGAPHR
jgi:hypothetical protein